ncbi:hypothetical protein PPERSA_07586 [Pseudocohnilembus persalinus]|uniref:Uncharacterized protein n=1 Tax=Pseudocohnilembus persalinus TaxID=266149 RepID=A0A0V0QIU1_PSEPJ|nr:hypothetical protein PPERSA_07586 [Pseudocohnilembus persalinus]|eukprot:KRX01941.1 hypothetical protein PPERSA_07586 [Pseudocohnilembus persalinus]
MRIINYKFQQKQEQKILGDHFKTWKNNYKNKNNAKFVLNKLQKILTLNAYESSFLKLKQNLLENSIIEEKNTQYAIEYRKQYLEKLVLLQLKRNIQKQQLKKKQLILIYTFQLKKSFEQFLTSIIAKIEMRKLKNIAQQHYSTQVINKHL